jgi:hypothetical protein
MNQKASRFSKKNPDATFCDVSENFSKFMYDFDKEDPDRNMRNNPITYSCQYCKTAAIRMIVQFIQLK